MKPYHFSFCVRGEPLAGCTELRRSDQYCIGREKTGLYGSYCDSGLLDGRIRLFSGAFSSQVSNKQQGNKDYGDRNENFDINDVKQMHHNRCNSSDDAGDGIPVKSEETFQIHRLLRPSTLRMFPDHEDGQHKAQPFSLPASWEKL